MASIAPASVSLSASSTTATANVTITVSKNLPPGSYYVEPIGMSGKLSHAAYIGITVTPAPEFGVAASSPADFNSGGQGRSTITISPLNGFTGIVNLASSVSPSIGLAVNCPSSLTVASFAPVKGTCNLYSTTPGSYTVRITATSGSLTHNATFVSNVGGFTISAKTPVDFNSGSSAEVLVSIATTNNFAGNITLSGSSPGLTVNCPTSAVSLSADASTETTCSLEGTVAGAYGVTVTGTASPGTLSHSATAVVHVGDFTISASSGSFNLGASGASVTVSLTSTFNFAGSVSISAVINPSTGLTVDCPASPIPLTANSTSTASCMLGSMSADTYQVTVTGRGTPGTASRDAKSVLHVGDFAISMTPTDLNYGIDGSISVSLTSVNNFAGAISLSNTSSPIGLTVTCPFAPSTTANATITAYCNVSSVGPGTYSVTITGTGSTGTSPHSASAVIHIGDFTISIGSRVNFNLGSPNSVISVNLTSTLNFAGTVVLTPDRSPARGLAVTCPAVTLKANSSFATYCTLSADSAGTFLVTVKGSSLPGTGSHSGSGIVQVMDFTVTAGPVAPSTIAAGGSGVSTITVAPINGFVGTVTLAVSPPSGIACSFDHTTIQSSGSSNLSCIGNTPGDYMVTVTAMGSSTFHQTLLTLHVGSAPAPVSASPIMLGLGLPQFYSLLGGIIVVVAVAGVTVAVRRKRP